LGRTVLADVAFGGQPIKKGDKLAMRYISGNRDEEAVEAPTASSSIARARGSISHSVRHPPLRR
jgi:hypothetical protein